MSASSEVLQFVEELSCCQLNGNAFNPWRDYDTKYDFGSQAPYLRRRNLVQYLRCRVGRVRYVLVAEAVGFQGARFSGVPLTSERILLGYHQGVDRTWVFPEGVARRTSRPLQVLPKAVQAMGFAEPTATIVWGAVQDLGISPYETLFWNAFPFHPFDPQKGALSNRQPSSAELALGKRILESFLRLSPEARIIAVGQKAAKTLGKGVPTVRHPANGGAAEFRRGLPTIFTG